MLANNRMKLTEENVLALLKARAKASGMTQAKLADAIGITPSHLCDVLHGNRNLNALILKFMGLRRVVTYEAESNG